MYCCENSCFLCGLLSDLLHQTCNVSQQEPTSQISCPNYPKGSLFRCNPALITASTSAWHNSLNLVRLNLQLFFSPSLSGLQQLGFSHSESSSRSEVECSASKLKHAVNVAIAPEINWNTSSYTSRVGLVEESLKRWR